MSSVFIKKGSKVFITFWQIDTQFPATFTRDCVLSSVPGEGDAFAYMSIDSEDVWDEYYMVSETILEIWDRELDILVYENLSERPAMIED